MKRQRQWRARVPIICRWRIELANIFCASRHGDGAKCGRESINIEAEIGASCSNKIIGAGRGAAARMAICAGLHLRKRVYAGAAACIEIGVV